MKTISILGSTGSIGTQTLEVARNLNMRVEGLAVHSNTRLLKQQIDEFKPKLVCIYDHDSYLNFIKNTNTDCTVCEGIEGLKEVACLEKNETVVTALSGAIGILPTLAAIECKKNIALANKETLVAAGSIVMKKAKQYNASIYPVDSEHSAIFQCLSSARSMSKIILTASGGPFRGKTKDELINITADDALKHPTWNMGKKITIDSATLMNKGLEVIEAKWLFDVSIEQIQVLIHPQSVVHSMVEFEDGSVIAQLGEADMRLPIQYALTYPKRVQNNFKKLDFLKRNTLTFHPPDMENFRCLAIAFEALEKGGLCPAIMNAANEVLVGEFIKGRIKFLDIPLLIDKTLNAYKYNDSYDISIDDILEADKFGRDYASSLL